MLNEYETAGIEREIAEHLASVADRYRSLNVFSRPQGNVGEWVIGVVNGLRGSRGEVIQPPDDNLGSCRDWFLNYCFHLRLHRDRSRRKLDEAKKVSDAVHRFHRLNF